MRGPRPLVSWCGIAILLTLVTLTGCRDANLLGPDAPQGIEGMVLVGPQCPVQSLADPCPDLPYQAWIDVRTESGRSVTRIRSSIDGSFRVGLNAGTYVLDPESGSPFPVATEVEVEVAPGAYSDVTISFDTGIR